PSALPHPVHRLSSEVVWGGSLFPRHWTLFTRASLHRMVQSVGFEVVEQASLVSLSFWTWSIHHWLMVHGWPRRIVDFSRPPTTLLLVLTAPSRSCSQFILNRETSNQRLVARRPVLRAGSDQGLR